MSEIPTAITSKLQRAFRALEAFASASRHQTAETVGGKPVTRKRLEELEQKEKDMQEEIERKEADIYAAKTRLKDLSGGERDYGIEGKQHAMIKQGLEVEIQELETEKKKLAEKLRQLEEKIDLNKGKIATEEMRIQEFKSQTGLKAKETSSVKDQIEALEENIKKIKSELDQNALEKAEIASKLTEVERKARLGGDNSGMSLDRVRMMLEESKHSLDAFINKEKTEARRYHNLMARTTSGRHSEVDLRRKEMDIDAEIASFSRRVGNTALSESERATAKSELEARKSEKDKIARERQDAIRLQRSVEGRYDPRGLRKAEELRRQIDQGLLQVRALNDKPEFRGVDLIA